MSEFKPPKDPALHALWVIRNWTSLPKGNMQSYEDIVKKVNLLASEVFDELTEKNQIEDIPRFQK